MKRTIIFMLIVLMLVGGGIALWQNKNLLGDRSAEITGVTVEESTTTPVSGGAMVEVVTVDEELKRRAAAILSRAIPAGEALPPAVREDLARQIREATTVLKNDYNTLTPWITLGLVRKALEDYAGAADAWEFASVIRPKNFLSFQNLGFLYGSYLKDYVRAEKNYLQAVTNNPGDVGTRINLADLYWYSMPEKRVMIPDLLRGGVARAADSDGKIALLARLAAYYEGSGDIARAISAIDEALAISPGHSQLTAERARLLEKLSITQ
ncbi:MAG: hypothetical protein Q7R85_02535 [bacterium]|nr:hypothetical protein [bacterium]